MRKLLTGLTLIAALITAQAFADEPEDVSSQQCKTIAKACLGAGYVSKGGPGKGFWRDCMKPLLLNRTVSGVTLDQSTVANCRTFKIEQMQKELVEFQNVPATTGTQNTTTTQ